MGRKPANFEKAIQASGLTKKEIAYRKNVEPATLSRHLSGAIPLTLDQAYDYAEILGCSPQEILFPLETMPVIISNQMHNEASEDKWATSFTRVVHDKPTATINTPSYFERDMAACVNLADEDYRGGLNGLTNSIDIVLKSPIVEHYVHPRCQQSLSYVCLNSDHESPREKTNIMIQTIFNQPDSLYTLYNPITDYTHKDVDLRWATPICATIYHPDMFYTGAIQ
ncbi:MAG: hypothetical protein CMI29_09040 [Opitutae bacterium]|nr:hypothetical protein [Opitutae bacterium]